MTETSTEKTGCLKQAEGIAERLDLLARLHDREPDAELLDGMLSLAMTEWFAEVFPSGQAGMALSKLEDALASLPEVLDHQTLDHLAAEFADIYLSYAYRISSAGSVWLTEDHLERQAPMFDVREWYRRYGIEVPDWRRRADDDLVHQLQFLAVLLRMNTREAAADAARFLDGSLLRWLPEFAERMQERVRTPLYVATAAVTAVVLEDLRDMLATATGVQRPKKETEKKRKYRLYPRQPDTAQTYVPGVSESW